MGFRIKGRRGCCLSAVALGMLCVLSSRAGTDDGSALSFAHTFLEHYPRFTAEGTMTTTLPGKPPYHCKIDIAFDEANTVLFCYNTDASHDIIPYDFAYADHHLHETIYSRDRAVVIKSADLGPPFRTVYNFVWDMLHEAGTGIGYRSVLFNGLMDIDRKDSAKGTRITLHRRIPAGPVAKVVFSFDSEERLKTIDVVQGDSTTHHLELHKFRAVPLPAKTPPPRH